VTADGDEQEAFRQLALGVARLGFSAEVFAAALTEYARLMTVDAGGDA